jgi:hypothetical protein
VLALKKNAKNDDNQKKSRGFASLVLKKKDLSQKQ